MIFEVMRTTDWCFNENSKPCKNARIHMYKKEIEERIYSGKLGIVEQMRLKEYKTWVVDINTLDELLALMDEVRVEIVIGRSNKITNIDGYIEIYDGFRE